MRFFPRNLIIRNLDGFFFRENFLVASIVTIFVIRIFLKITHYPQLNGAGLHIAHLLWGGFFMLVALIVLFSFLGRGMLTLSSVLAGVGFGAFIDELGKFITSDNNYFFQPTVALLYVVFISLYILSKILSRQRVISEKEYLVNALEMVEEAVISDLDSDEKKRALFYLQKSDQRDPLVVDLKVFFKRLVDFEVPPSRFVQMRGYIASLYSKASKAGFLSRGLVAIVIVQSVFTILSVGVDTYLSPKISFTHGGEVVSAFVASLCMLIGFFNINKSKITAFKWFKVGVLVSLLVTQFFAFYQEQFRALIILAINILLLTIVDYSLDREEHSL